MYPVFFFLGGACLAVFGARVLFQPGYVERLRQGMWKSSDPVWNGTSGYNYDKYARGLRYFLSGFILMALGFVELIGWINLTKAVGEIFR